MRVTLPHHLPFTLFLTLAWTLTNWFTTQSAGLPTQTSEGSNTTVYLPLIYNQADFTWQWQDPQSFTLTPTPDTSDPLLLAIDLEGQPHLWFDTLYEPRFIYHTTLTAQGWLTPTQVADTLGTSYTLFPPARDLEGSFHLLWRNSLGSGVPDPYRLMYARYANETWNPEEEIYRSNFAQQGMVTVDLSDNLHITSAGITFFGTIRHFAQTPSGWATPEEITVPHPISRIWPDRIGGIQFFGETSNTAFYHTSWLAGQQNTDELPYTGYLSGSDTQLDGLNNLHLFRRAQVPVPGGTVYGVYHRCLTHELVWTAEQVLSGETNTLAPLLKASDDYTQIALAWQNSTGNQVHIAVFEDCALTREATLTLPLENTWELEAIALSQNPPAFCLLARRMYTSTTYYSRCATYSP